MTSAAAEYDRGGSRRRSQSKGDRKEADLLEQARRLLTEKPLSAISVEDLTRGAGIARSSFYFYFASKEAVLLALIGEIIDELRAVAVLFHTGTDGRAPDVGKAVTGYLSMWRAHGPLMRAVTEHADKVPSVREFWTRVHDELHSGMVASIERGQRAGIFASTPGPPALATVLWAMLWRSGYEFSTAAVGGAGERAFVDALTVVFHRSLGIDGRREGSRHQEGRNFAAAG